MNIVEKIRQNKIIHVKNGLGQQFPQHTVGAMQGKLLTQSYGDLLEVNVTFMYINMYQRQRCVCNTRHYTYPRVNALPGIDIMTFYMPLLQDKDAGN